MSEKDQNMVDAGDLRPSNLLSYSGPGSIVNTRYDAVMVYGCNHWPQDEKKRYRILHHELLQQKLNLDHIRMPLSHERVFNIPCFSFPTWSVCEHCNRLQVHDETPTRTKTFEGFPCWYCRDHGIDPKNCRLIHARFAVICEKGHIDEFPWDKWVHHKKPNMKCDQNYKKDDLPWLEFTAGQDSSALKDYEIKCMKCHARRSCSGATDPGPFVDLGIKCSGRSPWLSEDTEPCFTDGKETIVRGIHIRAPSLWYSTRMSALKVPRWLHPVNRKLDDPKDAGQLRAAISKLRQNGNSFEKIIGILQTDFKDISDQILEQKTKYSDPNRSVEQINDEVVKKLEVIFDEQPDNTEIPDQVDILQQEYDDFIKTESTKGENYEDEFELETSEINENHPLLHKYFKSLKQIHKISTISVLTGFTRGKIPDILDPEEDEICKITSIRHHKMAKWFPGVIDKGEGIFFSLDNERLSKWENNNKLKERCEAIIGSYAYHAAPKEEEKQKEIKMRFNPRFLLLHTLSHLLIKSLAKHAGYGEPSIQERIYWDNKDRNGILLYTSGSSEGSLGGLVRLGETKDFEKRLMEALQLSSRCSRDPVCGENDPTAPQSNRLSKTHQTSGSSCHACCIIAETSCQFFNQFLDRWLIKDKEAGFFKEFMNGQAN